MIGEAIQAMSIFTKSPQWCTAWRGLPGNCNLLSGRSPRPTSFRTRCWRWGVRNQNEKINIKGKCCIWLFPFHNILKLWSLFFFFLPKLFLVSISLFLLYVQIKSLENEETKSRLQLEITFYSSHSKSKRNWLLELWHENETLVLSEVQMHTDFPLLQSMNLYLSFEIK